MQERTRHPSPAPDPMIGRTIHEFQVEKKLAEGGMGAVYLARHRLIPSALKVIKILLPEYAQHPLLRQRFHREAEAASRLEHENILGIDNFGPLDDGQLFIMVPYLDGQPLDAYLHARGGRLSPHRALHLVVQLCSALDYAHARGIIHRDLKPGNVYIVPTRSNPYMLKLLDFGIAKLVEARDRADGPKTQAGIAMGTPGYMAVEQYERADDVTHLADVYSLAATIWCIATSRPPWQHPEPSVLYFLQRTQIPERPPVDVLPAEWAEILLAALSVDPRVRPQSARELAMALASALPACESLPSGAEILAGMAPHFIRQAAPGDETVRNASGVDRIGPLLWPPRETALEALHEALRVSRVKVAPASLEAGELPTTLSAATGVAAALGEPRGGRWRLGMLAAGTLSLAALTTGGIASRITASSGDAPRGGAEARTMGAAAAVATGSSEVADTFTIPDAAPPDAAPIADRRAPAAIAPRAPRSSEESAAAAPKAPRSSKAGAAEEPAQRTQGASGQARPAAVMDPNDVSGPED